MTCQTDAFIAAQMILTKQDWQFIKHMTLRLPNLFGNFRVAASLSPEKRVTWAKEQIKTVYRDGWFINTPIRFEDAETTHDHVNHFDALVLDHFPSHLKQYASDLVQTHDLHESIAHAIINSVRRDLNPKFNKKSYNITNDQKERIETLAAQLLFEREPERQSLQNAFNKETSECASYIKALDKVHVMWRCVDLVKSKKYAFEDFKPYWTYWNKERIQSLPSLASEIYNQVLTPDIQRLKKKALD